MKETSKEEIFNLSELEILYNIYGKFIHVIRKENKIDGDVLFFEIDTDELVDLESYSLHGYKMLRDNGTLLNQFKLYSLNELRDLEESFEDLSPKSKEISHESLIELNWLKDYIDDQKFNYDAPYPVERIEIRYSSILNDFIFLYVVFDQKKERLSYMDMSSGNELSKEILDLYDFYPRDRIFDKAYYTPREIIELKKKMKDGQKLSKRL